MVDRSRADRLAHVEGALEELFRAPDADERFVAGLEQQLVAQAMARTGPQPATTPLSRRETWAWPQPLRSHRRALAGAVLLLVLAVALAVVGPQRVLAGIQQLLGYVPGIGFVDLEASRLLAAPVSVTRDGVTLRVEQAIAAPDRTEVVIRSLGLPPEDQLWPGGAREDQDYRPVLRLPDGRTLEAGWWSLRLGWGTLEFPPLPDAVYRAALELARLPLVPPGAAPENWAVTMDLRPATGELVAELFPQPYAPAAEETHQGITLRVLAVAHGPEETAIQVQVKWADPAWDQASIGYSHLPELRDDLGHVYGHAPAAASGSSVQTAVIRVPEGVSPVPAPAVPSHEETIAFAPTSPSVRGLSLWVDAVDFHVPAQGSFVLDLGDDPQVGDRWPLDVHLSVAGFPVHVSGARLVQDEMQLLDGPVQRTLLLFDVAPVPDQDGQTLRHIELRSDAEAVEGTYGGYEPQSRTIRSGFSLRSGAPLPAGLLEVEVEGAGVVFHGPWSVRWAVPGAAGEAQSAAPVTLHPSGAMQSRAGLALSVTQAVRTDRLTAVTVELDEPPPGVALSQVLGWSPVTEGRDLYLEDERGRRYELSEGVYWQRAWQDPGLQPTSRISQTLSFQPAHPLARQLTLHAPSLELFLEGQVALDVMVPEGVNMLSGSELPWPASEPWAIDVAWELAGYRLGLASAQLEEMNGSTCLRLLPAGTEDRASVPWLAGLRVGSIVAPDGRTLDLAYALRFGGAGTLLDLTDLETGAVLPGRYRIALEGATVAVPGPWEMSWNLRSP